MFKEGTQSWYAQQIGAIEGKLELCAQWARQNGGFEIYAPAQQEKMRAQILKLREDMRKAREKRQG